MVDEAPWRRNLRAARRNRLLILGLVVLIPIVLMALCAPLLATHDPLKSDAARRFAPPSAENIFGTDDFGRDVYSRVIYGARISLRVGLLTALAASLAGVAVGALAGYYALADTILMRTMEGLMAFPGVLLAIVVMAALGPAESNVVVAMSLVYTPRIARLVRAVVLEIKVMEYVEAAKALGVRDRRILLRHILPNSLSPLLVQITFCFAWAVLVEAGLSFVGLGTPPPAPSWGTSLADGRTYVRTAPWLLFFPGVMISLTVLSFNLLGDGLRDLLDPRMRNIQNNA
ncbi:MAG: ABC transporter permease [Caldilinea sp. CFX5]|nr:ABC transporter permease [Caldilinea sp. CFX5]